MYMYIVCIHVHVSRKYIVGVRKFTCIVGVPVMFLMVLQCSCMYGKCVYIYNVQTCISNHDIL